MAEEKPAAKIEPKVEVKAGPPVDYTKMWMAIFWLVAIIVVLFLCVYLVIVDEQSAINFIYLINALEVIFGLIIIFQLVNFYMHTLNHKSWSDKIGEFYSKKYKPAPKIDLVATSPNRLRFEKVKQHIESEYKEEWKIGIIELDNILRDLLVAKGYIGETVADLLQDGAKKGMKTVDIAWEAHNVRNKVVHEGMKYDFSKEEAQKNLRKYSSVFEELGI